MNNPISHRLFTQVIAPIILLFLLFSAASAQTAAARPDRGVMPNSSYSVSDIENISLQNGNVNLQIPLASLPPIAGGKLSWTLKANYNSKLWNLIRTEGWGRDANNQWHEYVMDEVQESELAGWHISDRYGIDIRPAQADFNYAIPPDGYIPYNEQQLLINYNWYKVVITTPDGAEHELRPIDYSTPPTARD